MEEEVDRDAGSVGGGQRRHEKESRNGNMRRWKRRQGRKRGGEGSSSECRSPLWLLSSDALISLESKAGVKEGETRKQLHNEGAERGLACGLSLTAAAERRLVH